METFKTRRMGASTLVLTSTLATCNPYSAFAQNAAAQLNEVQASAIISPFYAALLAPSRDALEQLLTQSTSEGWQNCGENDACQSRIAFIERWTGRRATIPNLLWERKEVYVSGPHIIVRGEDTGTPVKLFLGIQPTGRSFKVMTIDIHDVENGKIVRSYHVEDWASAVRQLSAQ